MALTRRGFLEASAVTAVGALWTPGLDRSAPPDFPTDIPVYRETYRNWAGEIQVDGMWTCAPRTPAEVVTVRIDEEHKIANVIVPERQLSLAIGKEGQNARLAAKLTGWRIDIRSETGVATAAAGGDHADDAAHQEAHQEAHEEATADAEATT